MNTNFDNSPKEVSCRVTNSVLKYLESLGYNADLIVKNLPYPYTKEYLSDPLNWVSYEIREIICRHAADLTGDDAVMYKVGLSTATLEPTGGLAAIIGKLTGPLMVYRFVPKYSRLFDRVFSFKTTITGKNTASVEMFLEQPEYKPSKDSCYYAQGILAAIPTLWNLPPAEIREIKCMYHPAPDAAIEGIEYEAGTCLYEVRWQPLPSLRQRLRDNILGKLAPVATDFKELEQSLRYIGQKNAELTARNKQLAIVREIALGVDKVQTIDEALSFTVEHSRDMEGVRMVLVQKMDETHENVITPYYSRFRPDTKIMVHALKAIGFDPEKELGADPSSNKLRFPLSKLKVALEYNQNPRVMIIPTLAELLDGVWPKTLCDAIQKIINAKKFVIVPLMVEGESWGHMLYFLTRDLPVDILEMIGAHCALAIKNIINLNNLELRNRELSVLNRIAGITSKSLDTGTLLNDTLKEIISIFSADAASIYISGGAGQPLVLSAQHGMPVKMEKELAFIPLESNPLGTFFKSGENTMAGTMEDELKRFPQFKEFLTEKLPTHFITSILHFGAVRYGLVSVVRNSPGQFKENEKSLLLSICNQLAVSLENSKLHADVLKRAEEAEIARKNLEESVEKEKDTEEKLRESEERYRTIFESANDVFIVFDNRANIIDINARIEEIGGYSHEDIVGKDFRLLTDMITKKGLVILAKNFIKMMAGMDVPVFDIEMIKKTGEHRIIQINGVALRKEGKITGGLAVLRDITGLKQVEMNLKSQKALLDNVLAMIPNAVLLLDKNLKVIMANQSFYGLFKLKKNQVEKKLLNNLIAAPYLQEAIEKTLEGKAEKEGTEIRYTIDSAEKILVFNIFAMKEGNILLVITDVTQEREKQERLYLTDRLASVGEMASGVAHELNNPLTSIMGLSGLLLAQQELTKNVKEDVESIYQEAQRCAAIVRNLLTFARKHTSKKEPVKLANIIGDVLRLRSYEHQANNIAVETRFPSDFPAVMADHFQMQQVFLNIILNAETAMVDAHGRGTLLIAGEQINGKVVISFIDDGPGISKENLGLLFNPFFTTKEVGKGTGLGLSISYGIVTSHGGKVYAKSEHGKGATFVVELPALSRK